MSTQTQFHTALRDANHPLPPGIVNRWGGPAGKRFAVYRNNVTASLCDALRDGFPATTRLLGDENFATVAKGYVAQNAPSSALMFRYGDTFADYLAGVQPLAHLAYLPQVARLEWQMRLAYHAADAAPIDPGHLTPETLTLAQLVFAPAVRLVRSDFPLVAIRAYALGDGPAPTGRAESVLITRPAFDPVLTVLPPSQADLMAALLSGQTLSQALDLSTQEDLAALLPLILQQNALHALKQEPTP